MWFLGLLIGLVLGSIAFGGTGALLGAVLGAVAGAMMKSSHRTPPALEARVQALENGIGQLTRVVGELQERLAKFERVPADQTTAPASETPQAHEAADTATATIPAPATPASAAAVPQPTAPAPQTVSAPTDTGEAVVVAAAGPSLWARLMGGNVLAKIGVVLLFFGVASGLKLAVQHGLFPVPVRLLLGAVAALAMIAFGKNRVAKPEHRMFGLALQGGGCAILYLIVYFMLARYRMVDTTAAFALFVLLGVGCVILAAVEDGVSLAVLGISGAFMAPVLAATHADNNILLFGYYVVINAFIIGVNWVKGWRGLNVCGFLFTFLVGMLWGTMRYRPEYLLSTEAFLIVFFLMYTLTPVAFALFRAPGMGGWANSTIVFGTPIAAAFTQAFLLRPYEYGLAWSALVAGLYYLVLWSALRRGRDPAMDLMGRSHLAIAVALLTLAVPLAFGVALTSALWALEGAALVRLGARQGRKPALFFGLLLQAASGLYYLGAFLAGDIAQSMPVLNSACTGALILAAAGGLSAWFLHATEALEQRHLSSLALVWGLFWWLGAGLAEIDAFAVRWNEPAWFLGYTALSVLALEYAGRIMGWRALRATAPLLTIALVLAAMGEFHEAGHVLAGPMLAVFPLALAVHHWILARHEREGIDFFATARHMVVFWLAIAVAARELDWLARRLEPDHELWQTLAWGAVPALAILLTLHAAHRGRWPVALRPQAYLQFGLTPVAVLLGLWSLYANLTEPSGYGLAYLPPLAPFDLAQMLALFALLQWAKAMRAADPTRILTLPVYGLGFVWVSMMAARIGHHWFDVPFEFGALFDSLFVQSALSLLWTAAAIALMITATRQSSRNRWFVGFALLGLVGAKLLFIDLAHVGTVAWTTSLIGVALLVLAASYFSPAPPKADSGSGV